MQSIKRNKLRDAIAIALVVSATGFASSSFAQDAAAEQQEIKDLDTIVVTGTRIQSQSVTASSPVYEIGADEFKYTGATRVDDLVNQFPQMAPYFDSFANNGSVGYATADLRALGTARTLVLVNGRRIQPGNLIAPDLSIIPGALIERVDLLTGGASAVYGADAVAGVVNFVLNKEFEGVSLNAGYSAYRHDNDDAFAQGRNAARNFDYPDGNSGLGGEAYNVDLVVGSTFADGKGHASAYVTYRRNEALYQSERDYSACSYNAAVTACGGSGGNTTGTFTFFEYDPTLDAAGNEIFFGEYLGAKSINQDTGAWKDGVNAPYNYAPLNYFQRPEEKVTFGAFANYEINEHAVPYVELMFSDRNNSTQLAPSGTFNNQNLQLNCDSELLGTACADLGIDPDTELGIVVNRRNWENGPRFNDQTDSTYRLVTGIQGAINDNWSYDMSLLYGKSESTTFGVGDLINSRVEDALLGCPEGSFDGCEFYNVWVPGADIGSAGLALQGTSASKITTSITAVNGFVQGDTGFGFVDGNNITLAAGFDWLKQTYDSNYDSISQDGDFTGSGGPSLPYSGKTEVTELFIEANVPILGEVGFIDMFALDLGYRYSDYELSGGESTYKIGFMSTMGWVGINGGYNRAIRAPNLAELFNPQRIALFGGDDGCAVDLTDPDAVPEYTEAQCANTGVTPAQYGNIGANAAEQYNQFIGGNVELTPEQADTWTFGIDLTPIKGLLIGIDYYDISIENRIGTIGAQTILDNCALDGSPLLCDLVNRGPGGTLWITEGGFIENTTKNIGAISTSGIDFTASYTWDMLDGRWMASVVGTYLLDFYVEPLKDVVDSASYECAGIVSVACSTQTPELRTITELRYTNELFSVNARWRYTSSLDTPEGVAPTTINTVDAYNLFDLSGSFNVNETITVTLGVNNIFDKAPPTVTSALTQNGNFAPGYDAAGQYFFANVGVTF